MADRIDKCDGAATNQLWAGRQSDRTDSTESQGSKTFYDAKGRVTGRTSTDSQGTTTIYDANVPLLIDAGAEGINRST